MESESLLERLVEGYVLQPTGVDSGARRSKKQRQRRIDERQGHQVEDAVFIRVM